MADLQTLFKEISEEISALTPEELQYLQAIIAQAEYELTQNAKLKGVLQHFAYLVKEAAQAQQEKRPRILGMHPGAIWISDDFTDPLPDEFWFGET